MATVATYEGRATECRPLSPSQQEQLLGCMVTPALSASPGDHFPAWTEASRPLPALFPLAMLRAVLVFCCCSGYADSGSYGYEEEAVEDEPAPPPPEGKYGLACLACGGGGEVACCEVSGPHRQLALRESNVCRETHTHGICKSFLLRCCSTP